MRVSTWFGTPWARSAEPERLGEHGLPSDVDPHDPGETGLGGDLLDVELHGSGGRSTSATSFLGACTQ